MQSPTLADLKKFLDITTIEDDTELQNTLDAAVDVVENIVGPITSTPVTEIQYAASGPMIVTRRAPLIEVTAISDRLYGGSAWVDRVVTDYEVDTVTGAVRYANGWLFSGDVKLTYSIGYTDVPPSVWEATLVIAANLWETQRGAMPLPANSTDDDYAANVGFAPAIPNRAKTLLEPHALGPRIA